MCTYPPTFWRVCVQWYMHTYICVGSVRQKEPEIVWVSKYWGVLSWGLQISVPDTPVIKCLGAPWLCKPWCLMLSEWNSGHSVGREESSGIPVWLELVSACSCDCRQGCRLRACHCSPIRQLGSGVAATLDGWLLDYLKYLTKLCCSCLTIA